MFHELCLSAALARATHCPVCTFEVGAVVNITTREQRRLADFIERPRTPAPAARISALGASIAIVAVCAVAVGLCGVI